MTIVVPKVALVTATPDAERHIEYCGRKAYGSAPSPDLTGARNWIIKRIENWEEDVLEHSVATFEIDCSRVVSHELVRHRIASYTQQSQRFSESSIGDFVIPQEVDGDDREEWLQDNLHSLAVYTKWRTKGYKRQTARYHLAAGSATNIIVTQNFRSLRHLILMRVAKLAQPEFKLIARQVWDICRSNWPSCFDDLEAELLRRNWL